MELCKMKNPTTARKAQIIPRSLAFGHRQQQ